MWPTLVSIGPIAIHSFGVLMLLGVFFGGFSLWQKGKEEGVDEEGLVDGWLLGGMVSFFCARAWQVLAHWEQYNNWYKIIFITKFPGLAYEGAFIGFWATIIFWILKKRWSFWQVLEVTVFSQLIVEIFGRIGQFLAVGKWQLPWELIWVLGLVIIYRLLVFWNKKYRSFSWYKGSLTEAKPGFLAAAYLLSFGGLQLGLKGGTVWLGGGLIGLGISLLLERSGRLATLFKKDRAEEKIKTFRRLKLKRKKLGFDFK
ncbi:MAG: prolipoprotein diacylglyceryl transferase family protein [Candidatus Beckwithbacteria bacterium]